MGLAPELVERFAAVTDVVREPEQLRTYECDGLTGRRVIPALVALPGTTAEVQAVVRICNEAAIPFVARGAGTGLSGGALPVADGIVISLARMTAVLEIDVDSGYVVVEPGVTNLDVTRAVADERLLLRARSVVPAGVHDRRQRRRELGRRALPQVRLHDQPRARGRDRAAGRGTGRAVGVGRRARSARRVRRLGGNARDRHQADAARAARAGGRAHAACRLPRTPTTRVPPCRGRSRPGSSPRRSR